MWHTNPRISGCLLAIINDGDGSECGLSYKERCAAAWNRGLAEYRIAVRTWEKHNHKLTRAELVEAADCLMAYYVQHCGVGGQ